MYIITTEKILIKPSNPNFQAMDQLAFNSKNVYNSALYIQRQVYFKYKKFLDYSTLHEIYKKEYPTDYKSLPAKVTQQTLKYVCTACQSWIKSSRSYNNDTSKFTGQPKLPNYLDKTKGRYSVYFTNQASSIRNNTIRFPKQTGIQPISTRLNIKPTTDSLGIKDKNFNQIRITRNNASYTIEIVYTQEIKLPDIPTTKHSVAGIDLGIDNFATVSTYGSKINPLIINGKGLKSYNKYFNKKIARLKSEAKRLNNQYTTKRIQLIYDKRQRFMEDYMHKASRIIINHLIAHQTYLLVVGNNAGWKQNSPLSKQINQTFIQIPYYKFIEKLTYKAQQAGITIHITEESYTSGTSFLDDEQPISSNYAKSRRKYRGLFVSNTNIPINADVNAGFQIIKKVYPNL